MSLNPCFSGICAARVYRFFGSKQLFKCLNPCFSGICAASSIRLILRLKKNIVLILVLVEYAPRENNREKQAYRKNKS